jgi:V8-like Glu-specific endopeptidase
MPNQYLSGIFGWHIAVLTLPKELPVVKGMSYGHWSDARFAPRTMIASTIAASLEGATVSVCGYPADKAGSSTQWEAFGKVQPLVRLRGGNEPILYRVDSTLAIGSGAPVWQKEGGLRLVAMHTFNNEQLVNPHTNQPEVQSGGLVMRPEIVDLLRQRIAIERIPPTF